MENAVLSIGTNLGDRMANVENVLNALEQRVGNVVKKSSVMETESWGFDSYPFLNQVVVVETSLQPMALLDELQTIEREMGRTEKSTTDPQTGKPLYSARIIDVDILLYGAQTINAERLTVPHPQMSKRAFVLGPLAELFGNEVVAPFTVSFAEMLEKLNRYGYKL